MGKVYMDQAFMNYESISERNKNDNTSIIDKTQKKFITMTP